MKNKLLVLQGIPGSGKSTWARELAKNNPNEWVIVNRDSIRRMLGEYWVPTREGLVTEIETSMIMNSIFLGYNVIIDATNLNPKTLTRWKQLAKKLGVDIEYKTFDIELNIAIERDRNREFSVGEKVITDFYNKYVNGKNKN